MKAWLALIALALSGCFQGGLLNYGLGKFSSSGVRIVDTNLAENGVTTGRVEPGSTDIQMVSAADGSTISGSSVMIPPGAIAIATDIMIEEAMPLATETAMSQLAIDAQTVNVGTPISVQSSEAMDAKTPMTISLPLPLGFGLSGVSNPNFVVMYRVAQTEALKNVVGIIPRSQLSIVGKFAKFETRFFGAYQVVEFSAPLEAKEVSVVSPAFTKSNVDQRPALVLSGMSEIIAQSGRRIQVYGKNFRSTMVLALGGKLIQDLKIISESVAEFVVPTASAAGRTALAGEQDGVTQSVPLFYLPGAEDLPIITLVPTEVCEGTRYYDRTGSVQTGSKSCSGTSAATTAVAASDIRAGVVVGNVTGTLTVPASCSAADQTGCVTVTNFPSVDKSYVNTNKEKIASTVTIAGIAGTLANCSFDGSANCLTSTSYPSANPSALNPAYIRAGNTIGGVVGTMMDCNSEGQQGCFATSAWKATNPSNYGPWDIRSGKTIANVVGKVAFYRNGATLSVFNEASIGGATSSTSAADNYDSIDDDNEGTGNSSLPTLTPTGGPAALSASASDRPIKFDTSLDSNANSTCDGSEVCIFKDQMTGLRWYNTGSSQAFSTAASTCQALSKGTLTSGWRLPSQKELQMAYINGIWAIGKEYSWMNAEYWTATTASYDSTRAYILMLSDGTADVALKTSGPSEQVLCVHNP